MLTLPTAIFRLVHYKKLYQRALWRELRTSGISWRIYLALLHRSHFPLKHLYFSSPNLAIEVKWVSLVAILLHLEFKYYYFYKSDIITSRWHPWWELDMLAFQWQVNCWRADWRHQTDVSAERRSSLVFRLRRFFHSLPHITSLLTSLDIFFFFFHPSRFFSPFSPNAEPGPRLPAVNYFL